MLFILLGFIVIGTSFALWQLTFRQTETNVITTGCLKLTLTEETDAINLTDATPTSDEEGKKLAPYTFTLTNTCTTQADYVINLETVSTEDKILADEYVKANLVKDTEEVFLNKLTTDYENTEKVIETATTAYKLDQGILNGGDSLSYSLRLWMDEETGTLDEVMNATWQGKVTVTATYVPKAVEKGTSLYTIISNQASLDNVSSEFVTADTGIDFSVAPSDTNGKGVYTIASTKDSSYPVHYFRGAVTNNNVKFANFCWKIVRTTETGGVKLIYNGIPNGEGGCTNTTGVSTQLNDLSAFNTSNDSKDYVGYMYLETNENDSIIKIAVDDWYNKNMTTYTNYLEDTVWCNDRSVSTIEGDFTYFGASERNVTSYNSSIVCPNENDKFTVNSANGNGKLTYPVALLTADEITLAGHGWSAYSKSSYLYTNEEWWVLSPYMFNGKESNAYVFILYSGRLFSGYLGKVHNKYGIRPSISLAPGTTVSDSGDGSMASPYEVVLNLTNL